MLCALKSAQVEFLLIGAYALGAHGISRGTNDIDIWVRPSRENSERLWRALIEFGAPLEQVTPQDFASPRYDFQIGIPPNRIDIATVISGVDFEEAWQNKIEGEVLGIKVWVIGRAELMRNKEASGRDKDVKDLNLLRRRKTLG
jgi:hypothetical protein